MMEANNAISCMRLSDSLWFSSMNWDGERQLMTDGGPVHHREYSWTYRSRYPYDPLASWPVRVQFEHLLMSAVATLEQNGQATYLLTGWSEPGIQLEQSYGIHVKRALVYQKNFSARYSEVDSTGESRGRKSCPMRQTSATEQMSLWRACRASYPSRISLNWCV